MIFSKVTKQLVVDIENMDAFIDDIAWGSNTIDGSLDKFEELLIKLKEKDLKIAPDKVFLFRRRLELLGHTVTRDGIEPCDKILNKIKEKQRPKDKKQVKQFLGIVGFYQRFIDHFVEKAAPLTDLIKLDTKWDWTLECEESYKLLQDILVNGNKILMVPDMTKSFRLETDASGIGLGACLMQQDPNTKKWGPIAFDSKKLGPTQQRYDTTERENVLES